MKVLFITNGFPPHRWAGTETYTAGLAKGLYQSGYDINVLCAGKWRLGDSYWNGYDDNIYQNIPVRRINLNWKKAPDPFRYLYNNPVIAKYLADYLEEIQPDIVHITSCETLSASVLRVVKDTGLPLVLSLTDFWFLCPRINLMHSDGSNCDGNTTAWECLRCNMAGSKAYRWPARLLPEKTVASLLTTISRYPFLTRRRGLRGFAGDMADRKDFLMQALTWPDYLMTASPFVRDIFISNGVNAPIKVHPYGHDLSWLKKYIGKTASKKIRIGYIGQIARFKGVHLLLQAATHLQEYYSDQFSISIYGNMKHDPEYGEQLYQLAENLPNVRFCGIYPHEESAAIFANLDVLVVPSLWYDFPLIIYEAFATRTPVIATNLGGMAEAIIDEVNGLLFERNNLTELTDKLNRVIVEKDLLNRLRSGVPRVKTSQEEVNEIENIYQDLVVRCSNIRTNAE